MKKEEINILLVDDHHMILEGYKNVLSKIKSLEKLPKKKTVSE